MGSTTLLLLPLLALLVLVVVLRRLPASLPAHRLILGLRLVVAAAVLAPAAVRCGPSHVTLNAYVSDVQYWRDLAERVPAGGGVVMPTWQSWDRRSPDAEIVDAEGLKRAGAIRDKAEADARRRGLRGDDVVSAWMKAPKAMSEAEVRAEVGNAMSAYERKALPMNAAGAFALLLAAGALVSGIVLNRRGVSSSDTPKQTAENHQRLSKLALRGAGIGAIAAVLWTVTGVDWVPDFGLIVPVLSLGACWPLVQLGRRLRRADDTMASDPEVLAEQRLRRHMASQQARRAQLSVDVNAAVAAVAERERYLASLKATAPGSPALAEAEAAVIAAQAKVDALKQKQSAPEPDVEAELRGLQAALQEKRQNVAVLASGGAPPDVIAAANEAIEQLRSRVLDLAHRLDTGADLVPSAPSKSLREPAYFAVALIVGVVVLPVILVGLFDSREFTVALGGFYNDAGYALQHPLSQIPMLVLNLGLFLGPYVAFRIGRRVMGRRQAQGQR